MIRACKRPASSKRRLLRFIIPALLLAIACLPLWILKSQGLIQDSWFAFLWVRWLLSLDASLLIIGLLLALLQLTWLFQIKRATASTEAQTPVITFSPTIIVNDSSSPPFQQPTRPPLLPLNTPPPSLGLVSLPLTTDPRTIEQREEVVKDVYAKLTEPERSAVVLTSMGGLAACRRERRAVTRVAMRLSASFTAEARTTERSEAASKIRSVSHESPMCDLSAFLALTPVR